MNHNISRAEGDKQIKLFLTIKDEIVNSPLFASLSPRAKAYLGSNFVSFIFEKDALDTLAQNAGVNCFRIYPAAIPSSDANKNGLPSVVIYPCEIVPNNGGGTVTNKFANSTDSEDAARQHPGRSGTPFTKDTFDATGDGGTYEWDRPGI